MFGTIIHYLNIFTLNLLFFTALLAIFASVKWRRKSLFHFSCYISALLLYQVAAIFEDSLKLPDLEQAPLIIINLLIIAAHTLFMFGAPGFFSRFLQNGSPRLRSEKWITAILYALLLPGFLFPVRYYQETLLVLGVSYVSIVEFVHYLRFLRKSGQSKVLLLVKILVIESLVTLPLVFIETFQNYHSGKTIISLTLHSLFVTIILIRIYYLQFRSYELKPQQNRFDSLVSDAELSEREEEILNTLLLGLSNNEIADKLCISSKTVENHTGRIYKKMSVNNRSQLFAKIYNS